ncbi:hypothetical protein ASF34_18175 [Methylobacterium sp. Leaf106]|nr:hypothetical protein ASF34_18175 [Methylobacterium sp. Leaf106]
MVHAITRHQVGQRDRFALATTMLFEASLGQFEILEVLEMIQDRIARMVVCAAASTAGECLQALLYIRG